MAKQKLMSAKARLILKGTTIIWIVMVLMLITGLGISPTTRSMPDSKAIEPYTKGVNVTLESPEGKSPEAFHHYEIGFVASHYRTIDPIRIDDGTPIEPGTRIDSKLFKRLVAAGYTKKPMRLRDPRKLRELVLLNIHAAADLRSLDPAYGGDPEGKKKTSPLLVKKGELLDMDKMEALILHGWAGKKVPVKGEDKIVGVNLTLPFVAINFLFLVSILYGLLWEPILKVLDERADKIRVDLETAETERADATELKGQYTDQLAKVNQERVDLIDRGRQEGYEERERIVGEARAEAKKVVASGKAEIEAATEKARKELLAQISDLSTAMATEIIRREIKPADHKALIDGFMAKMDDTQLN